jgi:dihydrofolate reductase
LIGKAARRDEAHVRHHEIRLPTPSIGEQHLRAEEGDGMAEVVAGITISLDGYITGPNDRLGAGLGDGGERLHYWVFGGPWTYEGERGSPAGVDNAYLDEVFSSGGAMICGRTMYDVVNGWGDDPGFGMPVFVVTHRPHARVVKGDTSFDFVTGGIDQALSRATAAAAGSNVIVMGGGDLCRQYLAARLVDEFTLTIAPVLLGAGKRLFDGIERTDIAFERVGVVESPFATHLRFRIH